MDSEQTRHEAQTDEDEDNVNSLYPTAVKLGEGLVKFKGQEEEEVKKHYETAYAYCDFRQHQSVSDLNLTDYKIKDYDQYFLDYYQEKIEQGVIKALPKSLEWPVSEYRDRPCMIQSTDT